MSTRASRGQQLASRGRGRVVHCLLLMQPCCPPPAPCTRSPWCGHCKRMVGDYQKLGETVAADPKLKSRVVIAKVGARRGAAGD